MGELENIFGKVIRESAEAYCAQQGKHIQDYSQTPVDCFISTMTEEQVLNALFRNYPKTEVLSDYSTVPLEDKTYYGGILLVPKVQKIKKLKKIATNSITL